MKRVASTLAVLLVIGGLLWPAPAEAAFGNLPTGTAESLVVSVPGLPNAFDWLPPSENNDILIASQTGAVNRWNGTTLTPVLDISGSVCNSGEMGLLGLAVDPDFSAGQRFVYLYYTHKRGGGNCGTPADRANRVSRFTVAANGLLGNERVLIDNIPAFGGNHNAGNLHFDNNDFLYISVGDSGRDLQSGQFEPNNGNARRLDLLNGKILRITRDGGIPAGNPFPNGVSCAATGMVPGAAADAYNGGQQRAGQQKQTRKANHHRHHNGKKHNKHNHKRHHRNNHKPNRNNGSNPPPSAICQEIFAFGLRNPFRFAFDPDDNSGQQRFYINDVGSGTWEEIDSGAAGADYGWNVREGPCVISSTTNCTPDPRFVGPVFAYSRQGLSGPGISDPDFAGCTTITGGAFVPDASTWSNAFANAYLFADFGCGKLFALQGATATVVGTGTSNADGVHLAFGPDGALYYTTFQGGGQLRKIVHS